MVTQARNLPMRATVEYCQFAVHQIHAIVPNGDPFGHRHSWFEALVRPRSDYGYSPADFIDAIYDARHCTDTDLEIVARMVRWLNQQSSPTRISINVHPDSLTHSGFVSRVMDYQADSARHGHSICLELVEFGRSTSQSGLISNAQKLRNAGVLIALDDFGTRLNCFDLCAAGIVDLLKIDTKVIGGLGDSPNQIAIVKSIQTLADGLDARVVAEGIETPEQLAILRATGVEYGQGYYFHKPELVEC